MKKHILIFILTINLPLLAQDLSNKIKNCHSISIDSIKDSKIYSEIITKLEMENKIDITDAVHIKMLSSNSEIAFEQPTVSIVKQNGKLKKEDIINFLRVDFEKGTNFLILTVYLGFVHLFIFDDTQSTFRRITQVGGRVVTRADSIFYQGYTDSTVYYSVENVIHKTESSKRYFVYDKNNGSFLKNKKLIAHNHAINPTFTPCGEFGWGVFNKRSAGYRKR